MPNLGIDHRVAAVPDRVDAAEAREAVARGVFGLPFYIVGEERFWGQDRLDFLERAMMR